jgi:hypothetical protein
MAPRNSDVYHSVSLHYRARCRAWKFSTRRANGTSRSRPGGAATRYGAPEFWFGELTTRQELVLDDRNAVIPLWPPLTSAKI